MPKIKVNEKALAHLSRGLYRSPASALRELISNAWDASATVVRLDTSLPHFTQISIDDNGWGFTEAEFVRLMEGGIGNSQKRSIEEIPIFDRPLIGRLGIGMLGIAQICGGFTITSKTSVGKGFRARIQLYDVIKEQLDAPDSDLIHTTAVEREGHHFERTTEVEVGRYTLEPFDPEGMKVGTTIIADDVHPTFVRSFQETLEKRPPLRWADAVSTISQYATVQELGDYWRLLWELAASCPVPYINENALPQDLVLDEHQRLSSYGFKVVVDGLELRKPVWLVGNPNGYTTKRIERQVERVYGRDVMFHGYILVQESTQLKPDELRGIMIRVKDVGIGYYDPTFLDYRYNQGPRSRWVTGEIFVERGLEDALNIDRDSFNRFHPEFRAIQKYVHSVLQDEIFPEVYKQIKRRSDQKKQNLNESRTQHLEQVIADAVAKDVSVKYVSAPQQKGGALPVKVTETQRRAVVEVPDPNGLKLKKSQRQLASAILAIFEVSLLEGNDESRRQTFKEQLFDLLTKW